MIIDVLKKEIHLFQKILKLENAKRKSILSADGVKLEKISRQSEQYSQKLETLEKSVWQKIDHLYSDEKSSEQRNRKSLKEIIDSTPTKETEKIKELEKVGKLYKKLVLRLKRIVEANQTLMQETNGRIQQTLADFQKTEKHTNGGLLYTHKNTPSPSLHLHKAEGKILNTDA